MPILSRAPDTRHVGASRGPDGPLGVVLIAHADFDSPFVVGSHHILRELRSRPGVTALGVEPFAGWRKPRATVRFPGIITPRLWLPLRFRSPVVREWVLRLNARLFRPAVWPMLQAMPKERCVILDNPYAVDVAQWLKSQGFRLVLRLTDWMPGQIQSPDRETNFRMLRRAIRASDAVIATSGPVARSVRLVSGRQATVVTNGVDAAFLAHPLRPGLADPRRVIYYGALDDRVCLRSLAAMARLMPETAFDLYTPSPIRHGHRDLPANIRLHDTIPYGELPKVLARYGFAILPFRNCPSNHGRFPMKLFEMVGSGVQVVAPPLQSLGGLGAPRGLHLSRGFDGEALAGALRAAQASWLGASYGEREELLTGMRELAVGQTWDRKVDEILEVCRSRS